MKHRCVCTGWHKAYVIFFGWFPSHPFPIFIPPSCFLLAQFTEDVIKEYFPLFIYEHLTRSSFFCLMNILKSLKQPVDVWYTGDSCRFSPLKLLNNQAIVVILLQYMSYCIAWAWSIFSSLIKSLGAGFSKERKIPRSIFRRKMSHATASVGRDNLDLPKIVCAALFRVTWE